MMTWNLYCFWKAHFKFKFPLMGHDPGGATHSNERFGKQCENLWFERLCSRVFQHLNPIHQLLATWFPLRDKYFGFWTRVDP